MSVDVEETITIDRPRPQVAGYAMDPAHDTEWIGGVTQVELLTDPPVRVGTQVRRVARFLGKRIDYVLEVTEVEPAERVVMRSIRSPFPMVVTYRFADDGTRTRASIRVQGDSGGFYRVAAPLLAGRVRRDVHGDLERLKRNLEPGRPTPADR
ncbi:MAG TPA: SRPBCC family protein [Actinomycetes bacterium]|jgi:uncharacterized membrane protein|nr:SRPBCC family protein [Actinomycetes bacterium]